MAKLGSKYRVKYLRLGEKQHPQTFRYFGDGKQEKVTLIPGVETEVSEDMFNHIKCLAKRMDRGIEVFDGDDMDKRMAQGTDEAKKRTEFNRKSHFEFYGGG